MASHTTLDWPDEGERNAAEPLRDRLDAALESDDRR